MMPPACAPEVRPCRLGCLPRTVPLGVLASESHFLAGQVLSRGFESPLGGLTLLRGREQLPGGWVPGGPGRRERVAHPEQSRRPVWAEGMGPPPRGRVACWWGASAVPWCWG